MNNWSKISFLPNKESREIQNKKLRRFIQNKLYPFSPYYRKLFDRHGIKPRHIKTVNDLKIIPFTEKDDFLPTERNPKNFRDFILQPDSASIKKYSSKSELLYFTLLKMAKGKKYLEERLIKEYRPIFLTATTGTANQPVSFLYSDYDIKNLSVCGFRLLDVFDISGDVRAVNLFPYAPHLAFWQTVFAALSRNIFLLSTGGGKTFGTQGNIDAIIKTAPTVLIGVPGYLYHLVRFAAENQVKFNSIQKVILGASSIPLGFKEKLAQLLSAMGARNTRIIGTYGFTEAKYAWAECPTNIDVSSGYHTYPDKEIFEIIDPKTGEVRGEGEDGELVYTAIDARGSCVLRYRTGDLIKGGITYLKCPYCKRTVPRISSSITRASNIKNLKLSKVKGTLVNLNIFSSVLEEEKEITEWQVEIRKKDNDPYEVDELVIYLSLKTQVNQQNVVGKLKSKIQALTEVNPNEIIILPHKEMLERVEMEISHKVKRLVDRRKS